MTPRRPRIVAAVLGTVVAAILLAIAFQSTRWVGSTFPGFFVMANRVVPSIALGDWSGGNPWRLFQHQILAVDGIPVESADAVYRRVEGTTPGTPVAYTARGPEGRVTTISVPARVFTLGDYTQIFGAYFFNGFIFAVAGLLVFVLMPGDPAGRAFLCFGLLVGTFVITAGDLYGPARFFGLHVFAESLMGAAFVHLALVFPRDWIRRRRAVALAAVYAPALVLAAVYEAVRWTPSAYTEVHLVATTTHVVGAIALIAAIVYDFVVSDSPLLRRRIGVVALGAITGFVVPAAVMGASTILGGSVPLNVAALTAFLFPATLGYAIVQRDLFEIDLFLRRAVSYATVVIGIGALYLGVLVLAGALLPGALRSPESPFALALVNLAVLFLIAPARAKAQELVDWAFFRRGYDAEQTLVSLGRGLSLARTLPDVGAATLDVLHRAFWPRTSSLLLVDDDGGLQVIECRVPIPQEAGFAPASPLAADMAARLARGEILTRFEWEDDSGRTPPAVWRELSADLLVPIHHDDGSLALLALGAKESGRGYGGFDATFLRAAANQVGLAMTTAEAFERLAELNAGLEMQVETRTAELQTANVDLNASVSELQHAYVKLEQSHVVLVRSDRLATLGRLAAGIAHEVNTPLSAVMNALRVVRELGEEYRDSIGDPRVGREDHLEIARELVETAENAGEWAEKASAFVAKMKLHGRDLGAETCEPFPVADVAAEVATLLTHRLRAASCTFEYAEDPRGLRLVGDPARLSQVLVNLVVNAVDACEERARRETKIRIGATLFDGVVKIEVRDEAGGIPAETLPHIFDELYTTKERGRGTGLGLWIARNLVEQAFAGTLVAETSPGVGSTFTLTMPARAAQPAVAPDPAPADRGGEARREAALLVPADSAGERADGPSAGASRPAVSRLPAVA